MGNRAKLMHARSKSAAGGRRRWPWMIAALVLACLVLPIIECAAVRWINPPATPLMYIRKLEARWERRTPARIQYKWQGLAQIPRDYLLTVLLAEDQRFFQHNGFDWKEIRAARKAAEKSGGEIRGASTISMQCARSLFLWQGRSWIRKGLEVYYTFWLERLVSKRRILELYANVCEMGDGIYGVGAAAHAYYGVEVRQLSTEQCIRLAAILPAPLKWSPEKPSPKYSARIERLRRERPQARISGLDKLALR